jgi:hypothetical protein
MFLEIFLLYTFLFFGDSSQYSNIDFIGYSYYLYCELTTAVVRANAINCPRQLQLYQRRC